MNEPPHMPCPPGRERCAVDGVCAACPDPELCNTRGCLRLDPPLGATRRTAGARTVPIGESVLVWAGACALAIKRHPHAPTPELADVEDARTVLLAAASINRNESPTHG
jgi:hypothetical protein